MEQPLSQRLDKDYVKYKKTSSYIDHGVTAVFIIGWTVLAIIFDWTYIPIMIAAAVNIVSFIAFTFILPQYQYRSFSFEVFEEEIEIQSGVIFKKRVLIPMIRVQHVELESGPIMRRFQLASIEVVTAATTHKIKGLKKEKAEQLKANIGQLAKVEDEHE